jgi:glycosyltransferase involved in cell wall biosynthesis
MESLLNQTLEDIEIIMVDDGSPDNCPKMCDEYAKKDARIKVVHKKNGGLADARNAGLDVAIGRYIAFVDSDDFVKTEMYEQLYDQAEKAQADTIYCGFYKYWSADNVKEFKNVQRTTIFKGDGVIELALDFVGSPVNEKKDWKYEMSVWHSLYSNAIIQKQHIRFRSEREILSEDIVFQELYLPHAMKVVYLSDPYYYYCFNNGGSLTHAKYDSSKYTRMISLYHCLCDLTRDRDPKCLRAQRFLIAYLRANAYKIIASDFSHEETIKYLNDYSSNSVWSQINYPINTLELHSFVIAFLQKHGMENSLIIFVKLVKWLKKILRKP